MPKNHQTNPNKGHIAVLVQEVLACLQPKPGESYLDLTAGWGGHAQAVIDLTHAPDKAILVDRDEQAIEVLKNKFAEIRIIHQDFLGACQVLAGEGQKFDMILADLGVSSPHFDRSERGFTFAVAGPLDMRMDRRQELTAEQLVNEADEAKLAEIIKNFGEEPRAKIIAKRIIENRPVSDTKQLAEIVANAAKFSARRRKIHLATRTFQALRIAVNDELGQIEQSLPLMGDLLAPGGRLAIISFHSLEDRLVKSYFAENAGDRYDAELRLLTKKPQTATPSEIVINPRARSAKLRAVAKIKTKERAKRNSNADKGTEYFPRVQSPS